MRALFVSFVPDHPWSGMGKWTHSVARELRARGHEVTLRFSDDYPRLRRTGRFAGLLFPIYLAWQLALQRRRFDVAFVHEPSGFWCGLARRALRTLPPVVLICHNVESRNFRDLVAATRRGFASIGWAGRFKYALTKRWQSDGAIRLADAVFCLSSIDEVSIRRVNPKVVRAINGVDRPAAVKVSRGGERVLFVGGWLDLKGKLVVPAIWSRVLASKPSARLTLAGTGETPAAVLQSFRPQERGSVRVIPRIVDPREMEALYLEHDIFLMPSLSEATSLALLEAMAAGIPSVVSNVGGLRDIAAHGENALVFESMDVEAAARQIVDLMSDAALAERISRNAAARTASYTWGRTADALIQAVDLATVDRARRNARDAETGAGES